MSRQRFVTLFRKAPPENNLDWDHHVSDNPAELEQVLKNILKAGVHQYHTYPIGDMIADKSSEY